MQAFGVISIMTKPDTRVRQPFRVTAEVRFTWDGCLPYANPRCGLLCCRGIPVFAHLEGALRQQVWDLMQRRPCQAGEIIIEQASWGRAAWPDCWAALVDCCLASCIAQSRCGPFDSLQALLCLQPERFSQTRLLNHLVLS